MKIIREYNNLALYLTYGINSETQWRSAGVYDVKKEYITDYYVAITAGGLMLKRKILLLPLHKYLWLLQWKPFIYLWRSVLPRTLNPIIVIPNTPPRLNKKNLTLQEKNVIKEIKEYYGQI